MADLNVIVCPECNKEIPISDAFAHQFEDKYKKEFEKQSKELEQSRLQLEEDKKKAQAELDRKLAESLDKEKEELREQMRKHLLSKEEELRTKAQESAKQSLNLELEDLKKQNEEKDKKLQEAIKLEIEMRSAKRALEEKEKNLELEMIRKMDEERKALKDSIEGQMTEKYRMQELENVKKIQDLQKSLEEAQRKAAMGSVQIRGEVQELDLEELLKSNFIYDEIREVPKGINGADVIHEVRDNRGRSCGIILWESKHTRAFSEKWIQKLKDDMIASKAKCAILVTETLPEDIKTFAFRNGVWVTGFESCLELTMVLRMNLLELNRMEKISEGKGEKMEQVYDYLSSNEFRNKIQAVVETFIEMRTQLDSEKRAYQRIWSGREKQIDRMMENTVSVVGDLQGLLGSSMPRIEGMELPGLGL